MTRATGKTASTYHPGRVRNVSVRQGDDATVRFVVTVALLYCAQIASGFGFFGVACTVAGDSAFTSRRAGYALMVIALLHGVAVVPS